MDLATIVGILGAFGIVLYGVGIPNIPAYIDIPSVFIVFGGVGLATIAAFPGSQMMGCFGVARNALFVNNRSPVDVIKQIVEFAEQARREGILALESRALEITDDFMKRGIQLAVDGTEPDLIKVILETEIAYMETRHADGTKIFAYIGDAGPAFGMIGTLIGLVAMLGNLSDMDSLGPAMATTIITTFYGSLLANCFAIPFVEKLKLYSAKEVLIKTMMLEGIMSLQSGDNPRIVEQKLSVFLQPAMRTIAQKEK